MSETQWFCQSWIAAGLQLSLKIEEVLWTEKSKYQEIIVLKSCCHGNVLVLNGDIQCTEEDEFAYHEMIVHLPLFCHAEPKQVLVIGGGDGGAVRELVKHPSVEKITVCEIDKRVIELCREYLPNMAKHLSNPKVEIIIEDGVQFIKKHDNEFDIIITDVPEPGGPAEDVYEEDYFKNMKRALKQNGIISCQGESMLTDDLPFLRKMMKVARDIFPRVDYAFSLVPTYIGGHNGYFLCSTNPDIDFRQPLKFLQEDDINKMQLKYYNSDIHKASFSLPQYVKEALSSKDEKYLTNGTI